MTGRRKLALAAIATLAGGLIACAAVVSFALLHSRALTRNLLAIVSAKIGCRIQAQDFALHFAPRGIEIIANHLSIAYQSDAASSRQVIVTVGYSALFGFRPLPLDSVVLSEPRATLRAGRSEFSWSAETAALSALARRLSTLTRNAVISDGRVIVAGTDGQAAQTSRLELDARIGISATMMRAWVSRAQWNSARVSGLSASGRIAIATSAASAVPVRATLALAIPQGIATSAKVDLALTSAGVLQGKAAIEMTQVPTLGQAGFDGSFSLSPDRMEIGGRVSTTADFATARSFPVSLALASPLSPDPQLSASAGPLGLQLAALAKVMGGTSTSIAGTVSVNSLHLATPLGAWRAALKQCADATCKHRQALRMLFGETRLELTLAQANLNLAALPPDLRTVQIPHPVDFTFDHGVLASDNLSAQVGALQIVDGSLRVEAAAGAQGVPSRITYKTAFPLTLRLSQLNLNPLPGRVRNLLSTGALLYARARASGVVALRNHRPQPRTLDLRLSEGLLRLQNRELPRTVFFHCRARLSHEVIRSSARVLFSEGGTLALDSSLALPSRRLQARIQVSRVDLQRWSSVMAQAGMARDVHIAGQADGQLAVRWHPSGDPLLDGAMRVTALTLAAPFVKGPVTVRQARVVVQDDRAAATLDGVTMGTGAFKLRARMANFAHPAIHLAISGRRLDLDALNLNSVKRAPHASSGPSSPPLNLSASVDLQTVLLRGLALTNLRGALGSAGSVWRVRSLSGDTLHGSFRLAGAWHGDQRELHVIGGVHRIDARRLLGLVGGNRGGRPPVSGELSTRINAGLIFDGGQPQLSCGGATIAISHGTLGKADILAQLMEVMSLKSWLTFHAPDLDARGVPFEKLSARLAFAPNLLIVDHVQLSGSVIRVAGHGSVTLPGNLLDLQLAALPFTSARWVLNKLPLVGVRLGNTYDRVFSVRMKVTGPANKLSISPQLYRTTVGALVGVLELPIDFVPDVALPDAASLTVPAPTAANWPDCVPPWSVKPAPGVDIGHAAAAGKLRS